MSPDSFYFEYICVLYLLFNYLFKLISFVQITEGDGRDGPVLKPMYPALFNYIYLICADTFF